MQARTALALRVSGAGLLALATVLVGLPASAEDAGPPEPTPADVFVPPAPKRLSPSDIVITRGPGARQLSFATKDGAPLALISVTTTGDGRVRITSPGADFSQPSTWRRMSFGDICWKTYPESADLFVLPEPTLPFVGPPGAWKYSNVIVETERGPVVFNKPQAHEYVTGSGAPIRSVIA